MSDFGLDFLTFFFPKNILGKGCYKGLYFYLFASLVMLLHSSIINNINTDESTDEKCFHVFKSHNNKNHIIFYDLGSKKVGEGVFYSTSLLYQIRYTY